MAQVILAGLSVPHSPVLDAVRGLAILQVLIWHYLVPTLNHHNTMPLVVWCSSPRVLPVVALALCAMAPIARYTWIAAFYAFIVLLIIRRPQIAGSGAMQHAFRLLGLGAYAIYLLHQPLLSVMTDVGQHWWLNLPLASGATLAAAWLSWRFIEQPCIAYGRRRFRYRIAAVQPV